MAPTVSGPGRDHRAGQSPSGRSLLADPSGLIVEVPGPDQDAIPGEREWVAPGSARCLADDVARPCCYRLSEANAGRAALQPAGPSGLMPCRSSSSTIAWTVARFISARGETRATSAATLLQWRNSPA